jgi:hypothetical protein
MVNPVISEGEESETPDPNVGHKPTTVKRQVLPYV